MFGKGLVKGLGITFKHWFFKKPVTIQYPEQRADVPVRFRGTLNLIAEKCIACGLCANACPNSVIKIETEKDENNKKQLTGYKMNVERCLFCGLCVEACPTKALVNVSDYERWAYFHDQLDLDFADAIVAGNKIKAEKAAAKAKEAAEKPKEEEKGVSDNG